jgi:hypothetical protein
MNFSDFSKYSNKTKIELIDLEGDIIISKRINKTLEFRLISIFNFFLLLSFNENQITSIDGVYSPDIIEIFS